MTLWNQNRTEPNPYDEQEEGPNVAPAHARARARIDEPEAESTLTDSEGRQGPSALLIEARDALIEGFDKAWPENAAAIRRYGKTGQQVAPAGVLRSLSITWAYGPAVALTWVNVYRAWVWQRPLRLLALLAVVVAANLLIPGSTPLWLWALQLGFLL